MESSTARALLRGRQLAATARSRHTSCDRTCIETRASQPSGQVEPRLVCSLLAGLHFSLAVVPAVLAGRAGRCPWGGLRRFLCQEWVTGALRRVRKETMPKTNLQHSFKACTPNNKHSPRQLHPPRHRRLTTLHIADQHGEVCRQLHAAHSRRAQLRQRGDLRKARTR